MNPTPSTDFVAPPLHEDVKNGKRVEHTSTQDDISEDHARARPVNRSVHPSLCNSVRGAKDLLADALVFSGSDSGIVQVQPLRRDEMQPSYAQVSTNAASRPRIEQSASRGNAREKGSPRLAHRLSRSATSSMVAMVP